MHDIFVSIYWFLQYLVNQFWLFGIFINVFTQAFIQPLPIDPLIFASVKIFSLDRVMTIVFLWTLLGSAVWYFLWKTYGEPIFIKLFWAPSYSKCHSFMLKWWLFWVFIATFAPIPYKAATWMAWIFEMNFIAFMVIWTLWRTMGFTMVYYIWKYFVS